MREKNLSEELKIEFSSSNQTGYKGQTKKALIAWRETPGNQCFSTKKYCRNSRNE